MPEQTPVKNPGRAFVNVAKKSGEKYLKILLNASIISELPVNGGGDIELVGFFSKNRKTDKSPHIQIKASTPMGGTSKTTTRTTKIEDDFDLPV